MALDRQNGHEVMASNQGSREVDGTSSLPRRENCNGAKDGLGEFVQENQELRRSNRILRRTLSFIPLHTSCRPGTKSIVSIRI